MVLSPFSNLQVLVLNQPSPSRSPWTQPSMMSSFNADVVSSLKSLKNLKSLVSELPGHTYQDGIEYSARYARVSDL